MRVVGLSLAFRLVVLTFGFLLGGCASSEARWEQIPIESQDRVSEGRLHVIFPPGPPLREALARQILDVLTAGEKVAQRYGLTETPFATVLIDASANPAGTYSRRWIPAPSGDGMIQAFPLPMDFSQAEAALSEGESLTGAESESLRSVRNLAIYLHVHELTHVLFESQVGPTGFHLWLNEGLAELVAYRTGLEIAPDSLPDFLGERREELARLPRGQTVDFLRWSPPRHSATFGTTTQSGEFIQVGWRNPHSMRQMKKSTRLIRECLEKGAFFPEETETYAERLALWEEWIAVSTEDRTLTDFAVTSDDKRYRWGIYSMLLVFFLEAENAGARVGDLVGAFSSDSSPRTQVMAGDVVVEQGTPHLLTTNRALLALLSRGVEYDLYPSTRSYPVDYAMKRLEVRMEAHR